MHGICHLLGYDHMNEDDRKIMRNREYYVLRKIRQIKASEPNNQDLFIEESDNMKEEESSQQSSKEKKKLKPKKKKKLFKIHYVDPILKDIVLGKKNKNKKI